MVDMIAAFKTFVTAAILIFVALAVAKTLYPAFPLDNNSSGIISVILGLFGAFLKAFKS